MASPESVLANFDRLTRLGRFDEAEAALRAQIESDPLTVPARQLLAKIYNAQGRRQEASEIVSQLIRMSAFTSEEVMSLIDRSGPFTVLSDTQLTGQDRVTKLDLGVARSLYSGQQGNIDEIKRSLRSIRKTFPDDGAAAAFEMRLSIEQGDEQEFLKVIAEAPESAFVESETWFAWGTCLLSANRPDAAAGALTRSIELDPTNRQSLRALTQALDALHRTVEADTLRKKVSILDEIFRKSLDADSTDAIWIARQMNDLGRPWEAMAWSTIAADLSGTMEQQQPRLQQQFVKLLAWEAGAMPQERMRAQTQKLIGIDPSEFEIIHPVKNGLALQPDQSPPLPQDVSFEDIAPRAGLDTQFISDFPVSGGNVGIFQTFGGGMAAIDFDLNGDVDIYVMQSGGIPYQPDRSNPNQLFRQLDHQSFGDVSAVSGTDDRCFGQGVCAGDINQDGWPDLILANIGPNRVLINQGDGTFRDATDHSFGDVDGAWTSSLALADVDGDHLPDLFEVNYIDDMRVFETRCALNDASCVPQNFRAASDRVWRQRGDGPFVRWDFEGAMEPRYGFGIVVANFDRIAGNDIFVANDVGLNQFWLSQPVAKEDANATTQSRFRLGEVAQIKGCAVGYAGNYQACMGVAAGDINRDRYLDLHITNFYKESVNLFIQNANAGFTDEAVGYRLVNPSTNMLGFGTQAADLNNDGWQDIVVLNGHVYDRRKEGIPYQMRSQVFLGNARAIVESTFADGAYFARQQLGRTLVTLDVDHDGQMDLLASHLDVPVSLLRNQTGSPHHWVQFELVGTTSERDAIGAEIAIDAGGRSDVGWQLGGDGLMATNQQIIHFGLGASTEIDSVTVHWPSGQETVLQHLQTDARYLIIEGELSPFRIARSNTE